MSVNSIPVSWLVGVGALLVLLIIAIVFYVLKFIEARLLRNELTELRETILMIRQDEANLSKLVHAVGEQVDPKELDALISTEIDEGENSCSQDEENTSSSLIALSEGMAGDINSVDDASVVVEQEVGIEEVPESSMVSGGPLVEAEPNDMSASLYTVVASQEGQDGQPEYNPSGINSKKSGAVRPVSQDLFADWFMEMENSSVGFDKNQMSENMFNDARTEVLKDDSATEQSQNHVDGGVDFPMNVSVDCISAGSSEVITIGEENAQEVLSFPLEDKEDERFRRKLERLVQTRMRNPNLNVDIIAALLGEGRTNFYRKVRRLTGMSPNDYLRKCRMERAGELLRTTQHSVLEISTSVGMPDAQYFSRVFKTFYGVTPSVYRNESLPDHLAGDI